MADAWYYESQGEVHGPLPFADILDKGRAGELSLDDSIRQGTDGEWVSVESISALFLGRKPAGSPAVDESSDGEELEEYRDLAELDCEPAGPVAGAPAESASTGEPAGESADAAWHARVFGTEMGPMPFGDLQAMVEHGELGDDDEVRSDDHAEWKPAGTIEGLFPASAESEATGAETSNLADLSELEREIGDREQETEPTTAAAPAGEHGWYCQVLGSELGPMLFDDLAAIARNDELTGSDPVRCGPDGEWVAAETVAGLFAETAAAAAEPASTASIPGLDEFEFVEKVSDAISEPEAESEAVPETIVEQTPAAKPADSPETEPADGSASPPSETPSPVQDVPAGWREAAVEPRFDRRAARPPRRRPWEGAGAWLSQIPVGYRVGTVVAVVLFALVVMFAPFAASDQEYYDTYTDVWNQHKALRDRSASAEEWSNFNEEVRRRLEPIIDDLARTAGANQPIKQHLLWAGRDYLPLLIVDSREEPSESEELFAGHMEDVRLLLAGEQPRPRSEAAGQFNDARPWEQGNFAGEGSGKPPDAEATP